MNVPNLDKYKKAYDEKTVALQAVQKEREKVILNRQQLEAQLTECNLVKQEMDLLEPGTNIFKLVGPALIAQNLEESKEVVNKRLDYINGEITRCEKALEDTDKKLSVARSALETAVKELQACVTGK